MPRLSLPVAYLVLVAGSLHAQSLERVLLTTPHPDSANAHSAALSAEPHVAGTPAQVRTATAVLRRMAAWGLDTVRVPYRVWLPHQDSAVVELMAPVRERLRLDEPPIPGDPATAGNVWPAMNGGSGVGEATGEVVYANYGLPSDYAALDSLGVEVRGRVVIARYGRSFRGIKAREAQARGAIALVLYTDPWDDGYFRGVPWPDGPRRPVQSVQRGSIQNSPGDPSTPTWASGPGAHRVPEDSMDVARIPVVPVSAAAATRVLQQLRGADVPQGFQGALPFRYRAGGTADVRLRVGVWAERGERAWKEIANTFGILRGARWPDEIVLVGGHRDSWGPGAADNVTGISTILEAARAWGAAVRAGHRPARTLVFATWDAEEWGLVGSTEFAEAGADTLAAGVVAYLNLDMPVTGRRFSAEGTASLAPLIREVAAWVRQPGDTVRVLAAWQAAQGLPADSAPEVGDLGGGSDHEPLYIYLGIPSFSFGFGGPHGAYHSAYDTHTYMARMNDPGFLSHAAVARMAALALERLGNAMVVPFNLGALGQHLQARLAEVGESAPDELSAGFAAAGEALGALWAEGDRFQEAGRRVGVTQDSAAAVNALLRAAERRFWRAEGIAGRPEVRNLLFASDRNNGYATIAFPGVSEAIEDGDLPRARRELADLAARAAAAAADVRRAREVMEAS